MKYLVEKIQDWLYFNRQERLSIAIFIFLVFFINGVGYFLENQRNAQYSIATGLYLTDTLVEKAIAHKKTSKRKARKTYSKSQGTASTKERTNQSSNHRKYQENTVKKSTLFHNTEDINQNTSAPINKPREKKILNPNSATEEELVSVGLNKGQAKNIINYRDKGGQYYKAEDLMKMYSIDEETFDLIKDWIVIRKKAIQETAKKEITKIVVDINSAQQEDWESLRGVGPYFARKIMNFRKILGGFYSIEQIKETFDLPPEVVDDNLHLLKLTGDLSKINIRATDFSELIHHPYINKKQSKKLLKLGTKNIEIDEEYMLDIFTLDEWNKVKHYLEW